MRTFHHHRSTSRSYFWLPVTSLILLLLPIICSGALQRDQAIVYEQDVTLDLLVYVNTTFYPIPAVAITITNAPRKFEGVTTLRWIQTAIETYAEPSSPVLTTSTPSPVATSGSFVLAISGIGGRQRRQTGASYVGANGTVTNDCTQAPIYSASSSGVLTETVNGTTYTFSTSPGTASEVFSPSTVPGSIITWFSVGSGGVLTWSNSAFFNSQAAFCALGNGTVYAVFTQDGTPDGCRYVQVSLFSGVYCCSVWTTIFC